MDDTLRFSRYTRAIAAMPRATPCCRCRYACRQLIDDYCHCRYAAMPPGAMMP